jgi:hypothetical protein
MNVIMNIEQYDNKNIFFCESIKNNVIHAGNFIKILYSTSYFNLNGIYLLIKLNNIKCEKYYNKYKCIFDINTYKTLVHNLKVIEENILYKINLKHKIPQYKLYEQLKYGMIKLYNEVNNTDICFVLKISGIWETEINYGLTFKFIHIK